MEEEWRQDVDAIPVESQSRDRCKVGGLEASALMPCGSARDGELVAKADHPELTVTAEASTAKQPVVRLSAPR